MLEFLNAITNPNVPFIRYALLAGLLSSIPFGIIGSFVVVKKMSYIAGAISHTALGGIGLALYLSSAFGLQFLTPMSGALLFALLTGLIISINLARGNERMDTLIGVIWAVGMSIGLVFFYLTPGYVDPMSYLFGNILLISKQTLMMIAWLNLAVIGISLMLFNQFLAVSFDGDFARSRGINSSLFEIILVMLISLTVILMISIVGLVMVIALLTIPPAIAGFISKRMKTMIILASLICAAIMTTGLFLSYILKVPTGSTTVLTGGFLYASAKLLKA
ncbi:MAG: metal ABC transporter permease, partial [Spirochaetaceae bacterium]